MSKHLAARMKEINDLGGLRRDATVGAIDADARTVELSFSSELEYPRTFGIEILDHSPGACDLSRLNDGAAVLWNHDWGDQRGVVVSARIDSDRIGRAVVRFSKSPAGDQLLQDIRDGVVTKVSVGYIVTSMRNVATHGDTDVYLVDGWQPFEISMVSVPADPTVGVGRTLARELHTRSISPMSSPLSDSAAKVVDGINQARNETGLIQRHGSRHDEPRFLPFTKPATAVVSLTLSDAVRRLSNEGETHYALPITEHKAGERTTLSLALLQASRVATAGARIIVGSYGKPVQASGVGAWYKRPGSIAVVKPAPFAELPDGDEVAVSAYPTLSAGVDIGESATAAVRFEITRAEMKAKTDEVLSTEIMTAIALGLAREADRMLLNAIAATTPAAFSLGAAATNGHRFAELRGIVGRNGAGAAVGTDGALRAAGIPAELTDTVPATYIGAFARSAVMVDDEIRLLIERRDLEGKLAITCFANMEAALPDPASFWSLA